MLKLHWDESVYREESAALRAAERDDMLVVGVDVANPAQAAVDVLQARRTGTPIVAYCAGADPLEAMLARVAAQIAASPDVNQRKNHFAALRDGRLVAGGVPFASSAPFPRESAVAAYFICRMADALAVFTHGETARWSAMFGRPIHSAVYLNPPDFASRPGLEAGVTVYAPSTPRSMLSFVDAALDLYGRTARYITSENPTDLPQTSVVIAPEWWRPARALALARAGFRVVSPARSGAAERERVFEYADFSGDALSAAIDAASSAPAVQPLLVAPDLNPSGRWAIPDPPLVSVIVRTFDRPKLLARALDSISRQTYPSVEVIVVNNGGPDVRQVVQQHCGGRSFKYIEHPERSTISTASNLGARAATGVYVGYLDDDDLLYPDHVAVAVQTLQSSGADLSYSDCVGEYAVIQDDRKCVLGVGIYLDREFDRDALYSANFAPIHSIVHRRDLFDRFGYFNEELPVTDDWDFWLRLAHGATFAHAGRPTCEYSWRIDPARGNMTIRHQQDFVDCYKVITAKWAEQVAGRDDIRQMQSQTLAVQERRVSALSADPSSAFDVLLAPLLQNAVRVKGLLEEQV